MSMPQVFDELPPGATVDAPGGVFDELPPGATLDAPPDSDTFKRRGVRQPDGTWLVQTPDGPVRLDDEGNPVDAIHTPGGSQDVEAASKEGVLNRILATAQGGAQGLVPQAAGLRALATGGDYSKARDEARKTVEAATEEAGLGYEVAGAIASSGLAAPESLAGRLGVSAGVGAVGAGAESGGNLGAMAKGAGLGLVAGGVGEALGAGVRKLGSKLWSTAEEALARQTDKDIKAVEKEIASLAGTARSEVQKGSRLAENIQRGAAGIQSTGGVGAVGGELQGRLIAALREPGTMELVESVAESSLEQLPGQKAAIAAAKAEVAAARAGAAEEARKRTADYFAKSVWEGEIKDRIKNVLAPRFGLAAIGAVTGELLGGAAGFQHHEGGFLGFGMGGLNSPGIRQMTKNLAKSNRVRVAVAEKLVPVLITASQAIRHGIVPSASLLARVTIDETALGSPDLAAEQLAAKGGLDSLLGDHPPDVGYLTGTTTPATPLDQALHQTAGVTMLAGALDAHHTEIDKAVKRFLKSEAGERPEQRPMPEGVHELATNPQALVDRVANNLGSLHTVAPGLSGSMTAVAERAVQHLSKLAGVPPPRGPMGTKWVKTKSEKRVLDQAYSAINDPLTILEHARAGTLTRAHVAAVQAVYPMLARAIGDRALDAALDTGKRPSYRQRQALSLLTGIDVDGELAMTAANQRAMQAGSVKPSNTGAPGGPAAPEKLTLGQRTAQPHQRERDAE
jgi:hypothetical protein